MRKLLLSSLVLAALSGFTAAPFVTVWQVRQAIRAGDTATLERKVDWPSVRASLKSSHAEVRRAIAEMSEAVGVPKPSLWQRIKTAATAPFFSDPVLDRYVTAAGAPQLYALRKAWREKLRPAIGLSEPPTPLSGTWLAGTGLDRALGLARRVERAAFISPTRVEIELSDRYVEHRRYRAVLEFKDFAWKLAEVHVLGRPAKAETAENLRE